MPNNLFSFKQFTIYQDKCAMKVCTDACVFGAFIAKKISTVNKITAILDIGSGTGLLSLMLAQKSNAHIDAIEIDEATAKQARENIMKSPWPNRIQLMNISLQKYKTDKLYDCIVCNPPFFEDDLKSADENKNTSKHSTTLTLDELIPFIKQQLSDNGMAAALVPFHRTDYFSAIVKQNGLFITETLFLKQSPSHSYFRSIILFSKSEKQPIESNELIIHDAARNYTKLFQDLLAGYYLKL